MKALLKKILPWHVRRTLAAARLYYGKRKPPFRGVFADFGEIPVTPAWQAARWSEASRAWAALWRRQIGRPLPDSPQVSRALLPMAAALLMKNPAQNSGGGAGDGTLRILDFGGAAGMDYANLLAALGDPKRALRYHVVDTAGCCTAGADLWAGDARISFSPELPPADARFDIVYAAGALNLVADFRALLTRFAAYEPACVLITKTSIYDGPSFVRRQTNMGPGLDNPQWALGLGDLVATMNGLGYELTYRGYAEDLHNVDNYPPERQAGRTVNLLFLRKDEARKAP